MSILDDRSVPEAVDLRDSSVAEAGVHHAVLDCSGVNTPETLFDAMAAVLSFPHYFGRNWDAFYECFSDYFILEDGGLRSQFGDMSGIPARSVRMVMLSAHELLRNGETLLASFLDALAYTRQSNNNYRAADLDVVLQVQEDGRSGVAAVRSVVERSWRND